MKKQKLISFFLLSFIGCFVCFVLLYKNFTIGRNTEPLSWQEIYDKLHVFLLMSFVGAIVFTFRFFAEKYNKKKK